mmetsp:Transcript_21728/g.66948  ORF Transcript_21728/g.66948 Transcript_21728/m.66948 type:complete len:252 (+) Transcript_21728:765-1520(+)
MRSLTSSLPARLRKRPTTEAGDAPSLRRSALHVWAAPALRMRLTASSDLASCRKALRAGSPLADRASPSTTASTAPASTKHRAASYVADVADRTSSAAAIARTASHAAPNSSSESDRSDGTRAAQPPIFINAALLASHAVAEAAMSRSAATFSLLLVKTLTTPSGPPRHRNASLLSSSSAPRHADSANRVNESSSHTFKNAPRIRAPSHAANVRRFCGNVHDWSSVDEESAEESAEEAAEESADEFPLLFL